jgi:hypothetical protein
MSIGSNFEPYGFFVCHWQVPVTIYQEFTLSRYCNLVFYSISQIERGLDLARNHAILPATVICFGEQYIFRPNPDKHFGACS